MLALKRDLIESETIETVYMGHSNNGRACVAGGHSGTTRVPVTTGKMEAKEKLATLYLAIPAANFDLRLSLSSEKIWDNAVQEPRVGWNSERVKRRSPYSRSDESISWKLDVPEVTSLQQVTLIVPSIVDSTVDR